MHLNFYLEGSEFILLIDLLIWGKLSIYCGCAQTISWLQFCREPSFPK